MIDECKDARDYLDALRKTAHMLSGVLNESEILDLLLKQISSALAAEKVLALLVAPDARQLVVGGALGLGKAYLSAPETLSLESEINRKILSGQVVVTTDLEGSGMAYPAAGEHLAGLVGVPLSVRTHVIGVLHVYVSTDKIENNEKIIFLNSLADLGALALERVRLQQSLYHIAEALNSSLQLEPMLRQVLEATVREMWLTAASIRMVDPKKKILRLVAVCGLSEQYLNKGEVHPAKSETDQRVLKGETVVVEDLKTQTGVEYPEAAMAEGIRSILMVPIRLKEQVVGVLRVYSARPRRFAEVSQRFVTSVARLIGLAIENAELYGALQGKYKNLKIDLADWRRFLALG